MVSAKGRGLFFGVIEPAGDAFFPFHLFDHFDATEGIEVAEALEAGPHRIVGGDIFDDGVFEGVLVMEGLEDDGGDVGGVAVGDFDVDVGELEAAEVEGDPATFAIFGFDEESFEVGDVFEGFGLIEPVGAAAAVAEEVEGFFGFEGDNLVDAFVAVFGKLEIGRATDDEEFAGFDEAVAAEHTVGVVIIFDDFKPHGG